MLMEEVNKMIRQPHQEKAHFVAFSCLAVVVLLLIQVATIESSMQLTELETLTGSEPMVQLDDSSQVEKLVEAANHSPTLVTAKYKNYTSYQVETGDSLYWIAASYGISVAELKELNSLTSDQIKVGERLAVPMDYLKYYPVGVRFSPQEVEWLAQMIYAEARGEPYLGQVAVGAVIINRILNKQFPNTLRGVLFQNNAFQPIRNGSFYMTPNESARRAALEALNGHDPTEGALFFFNPRQSTDRFMHSRPTQAVIGRHRFTN